MESKAAQELDGLAEGTLAHFGAAMQQFSETRASRELERASQAFGSRSEAKVERTAAHMNALETQLIRMTASVPSAAELGAIEEAMAQLQETLAAVPRV